MPKKLYVVDLTPEERQELLDLVKKGSSSAYRIRRANTLLLASEARSDTEIAQALHIGRATVERTRKRFVEGGLDWALTDRTRPGGKVKLSGRDEALLVAVACSDAPEGRERWTMQLLADRLVEMGVVESTSDDTVRRCLKKNELKPWLKDEWCIPQVGSEFVWRMEDVLDLYEEPYDPQFPTVCFDELPYQITDEVRLPLPAEPGKPERYDYEYHRRGTCNIFLHVEPQAGWRHVEVTEHRTYQDFAHQMKALADVHYPGATKIRVVLDNLNTHTPAALYEAFPPEEARRILRRLEFHHTPKHGSWLNMAEIEFSVLSRQCLNRRLGDVETVRREIGAWQAPRNQAGVTINWRFTTDKAREKLKRLYPS